VEPEGAGIVSPVLKKNGSEKVLGTFNDETA
jgi:hypothetical protein